MADDYRAIIATLEKCRRVLVTTHVRPDGDALGSTAAMVLAMRRKGIAAEVLLLSHLPTKYAFVYKDPAIPFRDVEAGWPADFSLDAYDALLVVDTGTWSQLPGLRERLENWSKPKLVLDHHQTQEGWADARLVVKEAAAAGEIVAELLDVWGVPIDAAMAAALFVAIATDTGWFQFSNTRPQTFRLAAKLQEAGVNTDRMQQLLYQNERAERLVLQQRAMQSMQLLGNGRVALMTVTRRDFDETHANVPDTENVINWPLQIRTVEVSLLLTETKEPGPIRVSLRSKGTVDVAKLAEAFGGGGHARASGLKINGALALARDQVVAAALAAVDKISF